MQGISKDLRRILVAVGISFLGTYVVTLAASALPLKLLQPDWIANFCRVTVEASSFPLTALVFIVFAEDRKAAATELGPPLSEPRIVTNLRKLALFVALGFLLIIPLQTWAGVSTLKQIARTEQDGLKPYVKALDLIRIAETPEAMLFALGSLPGSPANVQTSQLRGSVDEARAQMIAQIEPQIKARRLQLQVLNAQRWKQGILAWLRQGFLAIFAAVGFAAIGRLGPTKPTLLVGLQNRRETAKLYAQAKAKKNQKPQKSR
jgi:hypothetical protein